MAIESTTALEVRGLVTSFRTPRGTLRAVDGLSLKVPAGKTLCIAGESGCGKSVTALSVMGLLPETAHVDAGQILFNGRDLLTLPASERRLLRGRELAMIFQEPMTALNPVLSVGEQIAEVYRIHGTASKVQARQRALKMLEQVKIPDAARRYGEYPHQLSGGMKQRVMIAMALAQGPQLLIADEPTTALDVTIQAQVLNLLADLQRELGMAIVFVTHDLAVVAQIADEVLVMYAGKVVEQASVTDLFERPAHPYTQGLLAARPQHGRTRHDGVPLSVIPGSLPALHERGQGCQFRARCPKAHARCEQAEPLLQVVNGQATHQAACHLLDAA
jgi:oligopeptide/dipeptide ABC transporter ATP-binding protein